MTETIAKGVIDNGRSIARLLGRTVLCLSELALVALAAAIALPLVVLVARMASGFVAMALGVVWIGAASLPGCCALMTLALLGLVANRVR